MIGRGNAATPPGSHHGRSRPPPRKFKLVPEAISTGDGDGDGGTVFRVGPIIGTGSFGEIYHGTDAETKEEVAIKLESLRARFPQLIYEAKVYRKLQGQAGIPNVRWFGVEGDYSALVMDLLGPSSPSRPSSCLPTK